MNQKYFNFASAEDKNRNQSSLKHQTLRGLFWTFSGTGLHSGLQVIVLIVLARLLTPTDYGLVGAASIVLGISAVFFQIGVGPAIVQFKNLESGHLITGFTISLLFGVLLGGVIWIISPMVSAFFQMEELTLILRVMSLVFVLHGASTVAQSLLQRELRFRILAGIEVISYFIGYAVIGIPLALMNFGVWALAGAQILEALTSCCFLLIVQPHPKALKIEPKALKELIYFSTGVTLSNIFNYLARNGDYLVVGRFLGAEALGLYGRAYKLMTLPATIFGNVADRVLFPSMSKLQNQTEKLVLAYKRTITMIGLLTLPVSVAMIVLSPELIYVLLGSKWTDVVIPFRILSIGALFRTSYKISESFVRAKGAVYHIAWIHCLYAILIIGGTWIGQHWGILGASIGVIIALSFIFIAMSRVGLKLMSIGWKTFLKAHLPASRLSILILIELLIITAILRKLSAPALLILIITFLFILITLHILYFINKNLFLGKDVEWFFSTIITFLPKRTNYFHWIKFKVR